MTMKEEPVEMTWRELVENGLTDNSYVRLIDVDLSQQENPMGFFEDMLNGFRPEAEAPPEDQEAAFEAMAANMNFGDFAQTVMQPIKVYPLDQDPSEVPAVVVVPQTGWATEAAFDEIETEGTLTGRFTLTSTGGFEMQVANALIAAAEAHDHLADEEGIAADEPEEMADEGLEDKIAALDGKKWVYEPVFSVVSLSDARQWFWLSGLAVAVGLVICGAGGPSLACCVFFQGPSILSILGYPMRYGRAGTTTRLVYGGIGIGLISWGYQRMIVEGRFGQLDGDIGLCVIGFLAGSVGAAALLGAITSVAAERLNVSLEPKTKKKEPERKMTFTEACSLAPPEEDRASGYIEKPLISEFSNSMPDSMQTISESLSSVGFGSPESVAWSDGEDQHRAALIQLGCQEMVVADVEHIDGEVRSRLVSVLHDGIAVITLSSNTPSQKSMRFGTSGLYSVSECDEPIEMLSAHLEQTISMAEKRDTTVVTIEASEPTDVVLFARRVLTDIRAQYGEENVEVGDHRYGRFCFPIAPVRPASG